MACFTMVKSDFFLISGIFVVNNSCISGKFGIFDNAIPRWRDFVQNVVLKTAGLSATYWFITCINTRVA
ncbi:MAG: hypothetical protein CVU06_15860 [Bacteroidetes bacterium HGW-Bacteroidetes-22]|nr:MAG: hypothetical protein CVU06_15860 [Bacteroidetes bacterium HGW-Bacteroidetes-22]